MVEGDGTPNPSDDGRGAADAREENLPITESTSADQGTSLKGTWSDKKKIAKEEEMETDTPITKNEKNDTDIQF
jgi:hypothetical protein